MVDGQDENKSYTFTPPNQADSVEVKTDLPAEQNVPEEEELDLTTISEDEVLIPEVIQLNGREYAVGMFWQPLQDVDEPLSEVRQTMDSDEAYNLYALHYGRAPQYGIGQKRKGHKEGPRCSSMTLVSPLLAFLLLKVKQTSLSLCTAFLGLLRMVLLLSLLSLALCTVAVRSRKSESI